jgi:CubicO group peptidase (beta-lactamase class C family)
MNGYLQQKRAPAADIFNLVRDDVFQPIKFSRGSLTTLRTDNADKPGQKSGKAFGSHGLFYITDDVAKLGKLLNNDGGKVNGSQVLDPARLRDSLFRDPDSLGLAISGNYAVIPGTFRYNNAFWGKKITREEFPKEYPCDFWVARMGGYGGISIVLMPNGITYYVFSDNNEFLWYDAVREANKIAPMCPR